MAAENYNAEKFLMAAAENSAVDKYGRSKMPTPLKEYFLELAHAKENGKKLILVTGAFPMELVYACDCIPVCGDLLVTQMVEDQEAVAEFAKKTEIKINPQLCGYSKALLGSVVFTSEEKPVGYITASYPCNSHVNCSNTVCSLLGVPYFNFDMPKRKSQATIEFLATQLPALVEFIEQVSGNKMDFEKLRELMAVSNKSNALYREYQELRLSRPCPMSSRDIFLSELLYGLSSKESTVSYLKNEIAFCKSLTPTKEEKHRLFLMHNMPYRSIEIMDWLEEKYDTYTVIDGFVDLSHIYRPFSNQDEMYMSLAEKMFGAPPQHSSVAYLDELLEFVDLAMDKYGADVPIYLGNAGCRHSWSVTKVLSDTIQAKYGIYPLLIDINNVDYRYKGMDEIKSAISEYMETVVHA